MAVADPAPVALTAWTVQVSPAAPTLIAVLPEHGIAPPPGVVPLHVKLHDVASLQLHETVEEAPHPENEAVQVGLQVADADALPEPPGPVAFTVHDSPEAPAGIAALPVHATLPLPAVVPPQVYEHEVAFAQFHEIVELAQLPENEAVHAGAAQLPVAVALAVPPGPVPVTTQFSPAEPTGIGVLPEHATGPLPGVVPVQL